MIHLENGLEKQLAIKIIYDVQEHLDNELIIINEDILSIDDLPNLNLRYFELKSKYEAVKGLREHLTQQILKITKET